MACFKNNGKFKLLIIVGTRLYELMVGLKPVAVLMLANTNPCLSVIGAMRLLILIFQMEAGNRCQGACLPEETEASTVHEKLRMGKGQYILLPSHWEKNIYIEMNCLRLFTIINRIAVKYDTPILYSYHKKRRKRLEARFPDNRSNFTGTTE